MRLIQFVIADKDFKDITPEERGILLFTFLNPDTSFIKMPRKNEVRNILKSFTENRDADSRIKEVELKLLTMNPSKANTYLKIIGHDTHKVDLPVNIFVLHMNISIDDKFNALALVIRDDIIEAKQHVKMTGIPF